MICNFCGQDVRFLVPIRRERHVERAGETYNDFRVCGKCLLKYLGLNSFIVPKDELLEVWVFEGLYSDGSGSEVLYSSTSKKKVEEFSDKYKHAFRYSNYSIHRINVDIK